MSFYGNQYLEFADIFNKFLLKRSGYSDNTSQSITPDAKFDTFIIDAATPWIDVQPYEDNTSTMAKEKGISITHRLRTDVNVPQWENQGKLEVISSISDVDEESLPEGTQIHSLGEHGEYIKVNKFKVDEAGHVIATDSIYYSLPSGAELDKKIEAETTERKQADTQLQNKIEAETTERENIDTQLQNSIDGLVAQLTWKTLSTT